jgi:outer membrane protein OmpA-like peptidoglycan-associated protein
MIKYIGCLLMLLTQVLAVSGQYEKAQPPALGIHFFFDTFRSMDTSQSKSSFTKPEPGLTITYLLGLNRQVNLNICVAGSLVDFPFKNGNHNQDNEKKLLLEADASVQYRIIPYPHSVSPYASIGLGFSKYSNYYGSFVPVGMGLQANLSHNTFLLLAIQYRLALTSTQNNHFFCSIGIAGIIGEKKIKKSRELPPAPVKINMDRDGDGIVDSLDECPDIAGLTEYKGCPDQDGDGIPDKADKCPTVPGFVRYGGCPIPDSDLDGINDEEDSCIHVAGIKENHGCPLKTEILNEQLAKQAKNIFFETDKYEILPGSYQALDEVIAILKKYPQINVAIEGHTDNSGTAAKNKLLSENRAHAVMRYMAVKGKIETNRLSTAGYGASRPIANNNTVEGRAINRRVEIKILNTDL